MYNKQKHFSTLFVWNTVVEAPFQMHAMTLESPI